MSHSYYVHSSMIHIIHTTMYKVRRDRVGLASCFIATPAREEEEIQKR